MLKLFAPLLDELAGAQPDFTPHRYGLVAACDGGLLEVSGLSVPVGALCRIAHAPQRDLRGELLAEVIGFRGGRTLMMMLGDTVLLHPGARVRPEGHPGMLPVGAAFLGRAVDGEGHPIDWLGPVHFRDEWPAGGKGRGEKALAMRELAREKDVPLLEYPALARSVYFTTRENQVIREELYAAVAGVLGFVMALKRGEPRDLPRIDVPLELRFDPDGRPDPKAAA